MANNPFTQDKKSIFSLNNSLLGATFKDSSNVIVISIVLGSKSIVFTLLPFLGNVFLPTDELLNNILDENYEPFLEKTDSVFVPLSSINISALQEVTNEKFVWEGDVIKGGFDQTLITNEIEFFKVNFLTWRPQIVNVYPGIKQQLTYLATEAFKLIVVLYFKYSQPIEVSLEEITEIQRLCRFDVSFNKIIDVATANNISEDVEAYDIFIANGAFCSNKQRFIVQRSSSSLSHFFFQNTLGGFDTITSTGTTKSIPTKEIVLFADGDSEHELSSSFYHDKEVNTGYLSTEQESCLWYEFIKSTNKYILHPDGTYQKIVVVEFKAEYTTLSINSYSFTYRCSTPDKGGFYPKKQLENYTI